MPENSENELIAKSHRILQRAKKASREQQLAGLRERGVIDGQGNAQEPTTCYQPQNGHHNTSTKDNERKP